MSFTEKLHTVFTVAYLFSAFVITAATSQGGGVLPGPASGVTNFSVRSNCPLRPDIVAIRVQNGAISQVLPTNGSAIPAAGIDFRNYGFPQSQIIVGLEQNGAGPAEQRRCSVSSKQSQRNQNFDQNQAAYWFMQPGFLTTVSYDCFDGGSYVCSTQFTELPAGELGNVALY